MPSNKDITDAIVNRAMGRIRDHKPAPSPETILDESAVSEIEAMDHAEMCGNALYCDCGKVIRDQLCATVKHLRGQNADNDSRVAELEQRLRISSGTFPCALCGGPHDFDTSIPSPVWNSVIRARGLPDYLCTTCIVREFVRTKQGFTAQLWNEEFNGVNIEVLVEGQAARDAAIVSDENTALRVHCEDLQSQLEQLRAENEALRIEIKEKERGDFDWKQSRP